MTINWNKLKEEDNQYLKTFNIKHQGTDFEIKTDITFEPFYGNPEKAKIFFLALNPGYKDEDLTTHQIPAVLKLIDNNLNFRINDFPYYYLHTDEAFQNYAGFKWAKRIFRELIEKVEAENLSKAICCVQFHGYHSSKFAKLGNILPSQEVTFGFVRQAIKLKLLIVLMRSKTLWEAAIPELKEYPNLIILNNPRNPTVSKNNMKLGKFDLLLQILKE